MGVAERVVLAEWEEGHQFYPELAWAYIDHYKSSDQQAQRAGENRVSRSGSADNIQSEIGPAGSFPLEGNGGSAKGCARACGQR